MNALTTAEVRRYYFVPIAHRNDESPLDRECKV